MKVHPRPTTAKRRRQSDRQPESRQPVQQQHDGLATRTPGPNPQSQSFSRSYGSILPTSLIYIVLSTRGCSPWRPDAVIGTTGRDVNLPSDFQGPSGALRMPQNVRHFPGQTTLSPGNLISRFMPVKKKRELFPGLPLASRSSLVLPRWTHHPAEEY